MEWKTAERQIDHRGAEQASQPPLFGQSENVYRFQLFSHAKSPLMNDFKYTVVLSWQTRNWRHRKRASEWCKDYGLQPLHKTCQIGSLYRKERSDLERKLKALFNGKLEKYFSFVICSSCMKDATIEDDEVRKSQFSSGYEMVQLPENS